MSQSGEEFNSNMIDLSIVDEEVLSSDCSGSDIDVPIYMPLTGLDEMWFGKGKEVFLSLENLLYNNVEFDEELLKSAWIQEYFDDMCRRGYVVDNFIGEDKSNSKLVRTLKKSWKNISLNAVDRVETRVTKIGSLGIQYRPVILIPKYTEKSKAVLHWIAKHTVYEGEIGSHRRVKKIDVDELFDDED